MDRQNAPNPAERAEPAPTNGTVQKFQLPDVPDHYSPPYIPLNVLIDFAVQHCFHELTVLAELLPKKKETERKISVVQFGHSTRCIFLKLLALVRWLRQTRKLDITKNICYYLDQISFDFVETADILCHIRDEMGAARMPIFQIQHALEAVSLGRCVRVPQCIRKRYIPELSLKPKKQALTLYRLNQMIQRRLALETPIMAGGYDVVDVRNGTAVFIVKNEFEATASLLPPTPGAEPEWMLLHLDILVEDYEVGLGTALVHPIQVNYLHEMCQQKMRGQDNPLEVLYDVMHKFCIKLQLDILYCQAMHLTRTISLKFLTVESYDLRRETLVLSYWSQRKATQRQKKSTQFESEYRIQIWRNKDQLCSKLKIRHSPATRPLPGLYKEDGSLTSIHRLVSETVLLRCGERLDQVHSFLNKLTDRVKTEKPRIKVVGTAAVRLIFDLLPVDDCTEEEALHIAMNAFTGELHCTVPVLNSEREKERGYDAKNFQELEDLETNLALKVSNIDQKLIQKAIQKLQMKLMKKRFETQVPLLHFRTVFDSFVDVTCKNAKQLPADRICLQFIQEPRYYLLVGFEEMNGIDAGVRFFLSHCCGTKISMVDLINCNLIEAFSKKPDVFDRNLYDLAQNLYAAEAIQWSSRAQIAESLNRLGERLSTEKMNENVKRLNIATILPKHCKCRGCRLSLVDFTASDITKDSLSYIQSLHHFTLSTSYIRSNQWIIDLAVDQPATSAELPQNSLTTYINSNIRTRKRLPYIQYLPSVSIVQCSSASYALSLAAVEKLRICSTLHDPTRELELMPELRNMVNIIEFNHHKITMAYGEHRRLLVTVIYKAKIRGFSVLFTQQPRVENMGELGVGMGNIEGMSTIEGGMGNIEGQGRSRVEAGSEQYGAGNGQYGGNEASVEKTGLKNNGNGSYDGQTWQNGVEKMEIDQNGAGFGAFDGSNLKNEDASEAYTTDQYNAQTNQFNPQANQVNAQPNQFNSMDFKGLHGQNQQKIRYFGRPEPPSYRRDRAWNPHWMVAHLIQDDITRNKDLVSLVQYLNSTENTMKCIQNLRYRRPHTLLEFDENIGKMEEKDRNAFVRDLRLTVITVTPTRFRIVLGSCHLDVFLLMNNEAAIEGSIILDKRSHYGTMEEMPFFVDFWKYWGADNVTVIQESNVKQEEVEVTSPKNTLSPYSTHNGPPSAPSRTEATRSPQNRPSSAAGSYNSVNSPGVQSKGLDARKPTTTTKPKKKN
ncbi:unnamed protein product [Bursaphelenchus okinawaensis]|uniref:Mediator of RNA polymerase II transcription subunit 14 n=1 Tax=Bursaphelenchus okinawaensis TaxID=465554 RepID=A0A811LWL5_9BILA|nr:unnamed protein product [Bursaphelenchus okinawaensis]CAG9128451.1 unnamed protein product [Bursaphelenchus okinawaensis]